MPQLRIICDVIVTCMNIIVCVLYKEHIIVCLQEISSISGCGPNLMVSETTSLCLLCILLFPRYTIMRKCWHPNPKNRPEFSLLAHEIQDMISLLEQAMKQGEHTADIQSTYVNIENCTGQLYIVYIHNLYEH